MHHRSPPHLQPQTPLEGRLPRDCSRSIPISQTPWSIMHRSAWKVNSPKLDFRFTEFSEVRQASCASADGPHSVVVVGGSWPLAASSSRTWRTHSSGRSVLPCLRSMSAIRRESHSNPSKSLGSAYSSRAFLMAALHRAQCRRRSGPKKFHTDLADNASISCKYAKLSKKLHTSIESSFKRSTPTMSSPTKALSR